MLIAVVLILGLVALMIAGQWAIFKKAGEPGWASIIPIYNAVVLCRIAGKPEWYFILTIIPLIGIIFSIIILAGLAEQFGKGGGYVVGLIFLPFIFIPLLGFGDAVHASKRRRRRRRRDEDYDDDDY